MYVNIVGVNDNKMFGKIERKAFESKDIETRDVYIAK